MSKKRDAESPSKRRKRLTDDHPGSEPLCEQEQMKICREVPTLPGPKGWKLRMVGTFKYGYLQHILQKTGGRSTRSSWVRRICPYFLRMCLENWWVTGISYIQWVTWDTYINYTRCTQFAVQHLDNLWRDRRPEDLAEEVYRFTSWWVHTRDTYIT